MRMPILVCTALCSILSVGLLAQDEGRDGHNVRAQDFIGVFHPVPTAFSFDLTACPATHPFYLQFRGEAFTNLGKATFTQSHCEDQNNSSFVKGSQTITFANGEALYGRYDGSIIPTPTTASDHMLIIDGSYRNTGGTGRLKFAHGRGISAGIVNANTGEATVTVSGTL